MIRSETRGRVLLLSLGRPEKRNALDRVLCEALLAALRQAGEDDAVAGVVLAGEGAGFCAGADLDEMRALSADPPARDSRRALTAALLRAPAAVPKPVVAAVQGGAIGSGASLALACDAVVMAEDARFAWPEARHGIAPTLVAPPPLAHLGPKLAFELLTTGRVVGAGEALALHLANRVVPRDRLSEEAGALAEACGKLPPAGLMEFKRMVPRNQGDAA
jgi:enoyl-CoA hydratase